MAPMLCLMSKPSLPFTQPTENPTAARLGFWRCTACAAVCSFGKNPIHAACPRCHATVSPRTPHAIAHCWAYLMAAMALYIPANLLPVTRTSSFLGTQDDTILSGILYLWVEGSWVLALLVFVASIVVPLSKLIVLSYLLISVQRRATHLPMRRLALYRALEVVGRWSMLDIYVITFLAALVQIQSLALITPGPGAMAFGAVVVLTMLATHSFDPRLIWDAVETSTAEASSPHSLAPSPPDFEPTP